MSEPRSKSRERKSIVKGAGSPEEIEQLIKEEEEVQTKVISVYNQQHADADLELVSYKIEYGLLILCLKYNFVSSLRDLDRLLNAVLLSQSEKEKLLSIDYKWQCESKHLTAFVPLSEIFPDKRKKEKTGKSRRGLILAVFAVMLLTLYVAQLRMQYVLF